MTLALWGGFLVTTWGPGPPFGTVQSGQTEPCLPWRRWLLVGFKDYYWRIGWRAGWLDDWAGTFVLHRTVLITIASGNWCWLMEVLHGRVVARMTGGPRDRDLWYGGSE